MTDLATLAIEVRTNGANRATRDLHNVERASKQTEKAVDSLSVAVNALKRLMALGIGIQGLSGFLQMADIVPLPLDWNDKQAFGKVAKAMFAAAKQLNVAIRWGGDWNRNGRSDDETFYDGSHFELLKAVYP